MKIEETEVSGLRVAIKAMRNPMNSWHLSDSYVDESGVFVVGPKDNELAKKQIKAGQDHRKFLRLIHVSCFITLPRYIWTELDTYKVSTVRLSCSTMHKLGSVELEPEDFQDDVILINTLSELNFLGKVYRESKKVETLRQMKQILPEGFLQSATYDASYETLMNIYYGRKSHRMSEWTDEDGICKWIESLPMMNEWLNL